MPLLGIRSHLPQHCPRYFEGHTPSPLCREHIQWSPGANSSLNGSRTETLWVPAVPGHLRGIKSPTSVVNLLKNHICLHLTCDLSSFKANFLHLKELDIYTGDL